MKLTLLFILCLVIIACNPNGTKNKNQESIQTVVDSSNKSTQISELKLTKQKQDSTNNTTEAEKLVTDFYKYYVTNSLNDGYEFLKDNTLKKYISKRKLEEIKAQAKTEDGIDADPFLQAQDVFPNWKNIFIKTAKKVDSTNTEIELKLGDDQNAKNLKIIVFKQNGIRVIDKVETTN